MKPHEGNVAAIDEYLTMLQTLKRQPGYDLLMAQVDALTRAAFGKLIATTDPTELAKEVGKVTVLRDVRSWVDSEIQAFLEAAEQNRKSQK